MVLKITVFVLVATTVLAEPVPEPNTRCDLRHPAAGLTKRYWEAIAHAVHSLDLQNLQKFNPSADADNHIPTVNLNLKVSP